MQSRTAPSRLHPTQRESFASRERSPSRASSQAGNEGGAAELWRAHKPLLVAPSIVACSRVVHVRRQANSVPSPVPQSSPPRPRDRKRPRRAARRPRTSSAPTRVRARRPSPYRRSTPMKKGSPAVSGGMFFYCCGARVSTIVHVIPTDL